MHPIPEDFDLHNYRFDLPEDRIAQRPAPQRDASKLMLLDRKTGTRAIHGFSDLPNLLPKDALLVANNSKVVAARVYGTKPTGGKIEFLMLTPLPYLKPETENGWQCASAEGLLKSSKPARPGDVLDLADDFKVIPRERGDFGRWQVELRWKGDIADIFSRHGHLPLPPYIHRPDDATDQNRYQTTYSREDRAGSVAAPTAGLHFTPQLRQTLREAGFGWEEVTLYVGYGTFSPVRCRDIREHRMHNEWIEVPEHTAEAIRKAKAEGRPVIPVGTTSARTLEGMFRACGEICAFSGETDIFIKPGYTFNVADGLLTNFHLPESSLIIMVSALAGRETVLETYRHALANEFRFFSYGDAMLVL